jgi:hypothetical protein
MTKNIEIRIVIDPSIVNYFEEGMSKRHIDCSAAEEITEFLTVVLNDMMYPITSSKKSEQEVHLNYHPRSFADPIF